MKNVRIQNIHQNRRKPGIIYAELRELTGELCVMATLDYIFEVLNDASREYNCINAEKDKFGNWSLPL